MERPQQPDNNRLRDLLKHADPVPPGATLTAVEQETIRRSWLRGRRVSDPPRSGRRWIAWWALPGLAAAAIAIAVSQGVLPGGESRLRTLPTRPRVEATGDQQPASSLETGRRQIQFTGSRGSRIVWFLITEKPT